MNYFNFDLMFFDYVVLVLATIIVVLSFLKGFINSILGLLTWVGSVFITIYSYEYISGFINNSLLEISFFQNFEQYVSILSTILSILIIFFISLLILKKVRIFLSSDLDKNILGIILDKTFGIIYGLIFTYILFSSILYLTDSNSIELLYKINLYLIDNSKILNQISSYNNNFIQAYSVNQ